MKILLTGATGLVGSVLLRDLLAAGHEVLVLARGRNQFGAESRVRSVLATQGWRSDDSRLQVIDGGPTSIAAELALRGQPEAVVHAAAAVKFSSSFEELLRTNVQATEELLEHLDEHAPGCHVHFISTAYVCGDRLDLCHESEADRGQGFRQPYERSKLMAEFVVRESCRRSGRPFSIYRPSIIMGSSVDGAAANFNGLAQLLKTLDALTRNGGARALATTPLRIPCAPAATKNVVPVDWVASCLRRLVERPRAGAVYHLTHPRPLTHEQLRDALREITGLQGLEIGALDVGEDAERSAQSVVLRKALRRFEPYLWGEPSFDRRNLESDLHGDAVPPAVDTAYLQRVMTFGRQVAWTARPFETLTEAADVITALPGETHA